MTLDFVLQKPLNTRYAAKFVEMCNELPFIVRILTEDERPINGKSLLGVLSGGFKENDTIHLIVQNKKQADIVKAQISELGII